MGKLEVANEGYTGLLIDNNGKYAVEIRYFRYALS
jgi:hypothetical protein